MNGGNWRSSITSLAMTALLVAVALNIAVHLIEAVAPVLIGLGIGAVIGYVGWLIRDNRRSKW